MAEHLRADVGDNAAAFATLWREKTLEYSFRRGLMQHYAGARLLAQRFQIDISAAGRLMEASEWLPAFPDAAPALARLRAAGHRLFAFSNGTAAHVDALLRYASLRTLFDGIVSVDDMRTFKPAPAVYAYARRATGAWSDPCWLGSGNAWDVIGAHAAGLDAAWIRRSEAQVFDPWGIEPTLMSPR